MDCSRDGLTLNKLQFKRLLGAKLSPRPHHANQISHTMSVNEELEKVETPGHKFKSQLREDTYECYV